MRRFARFASAAAALALGLAAAPAHASTCVPPTVDWSDFPGGYQCIVGVDHFILNHWGLTFPATGGHPGKDGCAELGACIEWVDDLPDKNTWNRHDWGSVPGQPYDILIFPPSGNNAYGHAAAFDHMDGSTLYVMDDNWDGNENKSCSWAGHEGWVHSIGPSYAPYGFYRLKTLEPPPPDVAPRGSLDGVACDTGATGWSQDPDEPDKSIDVHVYWGGEAGSGAPGIPTHADQHRDDLCGAIGSCNHGFTMGVPLGMRDGQPHDVFAYGIDSKAGASNAKLDNAPKQVSCPPPKAPFSPAMRRHVIDPASLAAWKLDGFMDVARFTDAMTKAITSGPAAPTAPTLAKSDDGSATIWVLDGGEKRRVPSDAAMSAWRFDAGAAATMGAADLAAIPEGRVWPEVAFSFMSPDGTVYLLDVLPPPPKPPGGGGGAGGAGSGSGSGASDPGDGPADIHGSVTPTGANAASASDDGDNAITGSCAASPARTGRGAFALLAAAIGLAFARRRRR
jgi:hypothetical protein